ncbi:Rap1a/Tai family immunity protein [Sinorhizobium meliloti]|uniref:Rap1a/Tai family immunity protein n=1 Tax=Rhizobium meliloti TaxID=382 RepID=UPI003704A75F
MIMRYIAATTILFALTQVSHATDGSFLLNSCNELLNETSEGVADQLTAPNTLASGFCYGSMTTLQQLSNLQWPGNNEPMLGLCVPSAVRTTQYARIVIKYLQAHPEKLHEDGSYLAWQALQEVYPYSSSCRR